MKRLLPAATLLTAFVSANVHADGASPCSSMKTLADAQACLKTLGKVVKGYPPGVEGATEEVMNKAEEVADTQNSGSEDDQSSTANSTSTSNDDDDK